MFPSRALLSLTSALALAAAPAPPTAGTASGTLKVGPASIAIVHARAHLHDNAEGSLDFTPELRILLADRTTPDDELRGLNPALDALPNHVAEGKLQGLYIRVQKDLHAAVVTLLYKPENGGQSLTNETITNSNAPALKRIQVTDTEVEGEIEAHPDEDFDPAFPRGDYRITFHAPITKEPPVTADLKGPVARQSPQVQVLQARARALAKGDLKTARTYMTEEAAKRDEAMAAQLGDTAVKYAKEGGAEMVKALVKVKRVVVRGDRAVVMVEGSEVEMEKANGKWAVR